MFQNLHFYNQTAIHDYIEALYQSGHISTVRSKLKVSEHVEVNCNIFVIWQFIAARVPSLSHYSSSRHLYPVCHITVHRATCTQSVTLQFIAPRVRSLSHYSSSRHVYPVCHITVHRATCTQSVALQFIAPRVPILSHYSLFLHAYPIFDFNSRYQWTTSVVALHMFQFPVTRLHFLHQGTPVWTFPGSALQCFQPLSPAL